MRTVPNFACFSSPMRAVLTLTFCTGASAWLGACAHDADEPTQFVREAGTQASPGTVSEDAGVAQVSSNDASSALPPGRIEPGKADAGNSAADASTSQGDAGATGLPDAGLSARYAAVGEISKAFQDNAYARYPELAKQIDAAAKSYPDDATIARFAAVLRLWRLTEASRDPALTLLDLAPVLIEAQGRFETARKLAPSDGRLLGWSGALTFRSGQQLGLDAQVAKGKQELEDSIASYPSFNLFVQGAALAALPLTDPDFMSAAEKMYGTLEACGYKLDRANPVFTPPSTKPGDGVCGNSSFAPYNLHGLFLNLGDVMTKAGKLDVAEVLYRNAMRVPQYDTWPYREHLEQRIRDLASNAASLRDGDAKNDFKMPIEAGYFCVTCHATKL